MPSKSPGSPLRPTIVRRGERGAPVRVAGRLPGQRRDHEAGGDRVAAHAAGGPGLGLGPGQRGQPALGGAVRPAVAERPDRLLRATLMIRPQPRSAMPGPNRWPSRNGAVRLTAMVWSHWPMVSARIGGRRLIAGRVDQDVGLAEAAAAASAPRQRGPVAEVGADPRRVRAARGARGGRRLRARPRRGRAGRPGLPRRPGRRPIARPMPELPPVTSATLPSSENSSRR